MRIDNPFCSSASGPLTRRWGLIPYWCSDPKGDRKPINAKSEMVVRLTVSHCPQAPVRSQIQPYLAVVFEANAILTSNPSLIGIVFSTRFHET